MLQLFPSRVGIFAMAMLLLNPTAEAGPRAEPIVRISEIEIASSDLDAYLAILKEESAASVRLEPGVIAIFPMVQKDHPTEVRILEFYANQAAYELHLQTPHFQRYKASTLSMVKKLKLIDMRPIDESSMSLIFRKTS